MKLNFKLLFYVSIILNVLGLGLMSMLDNRFIEQRAVKESYRDALYRKAKHEEVVIKYAQYITKYSRVHHGRSKEYARYILAASKAHNIDPKLMLVQFRTESNYRAGVVSPAGAIGISQIMPYNCRAIPGCNSIRDLFDPEKSIHFGAYWLRKDLDKWGDVRKAIRAYNGGGGGVYNPKWETRDYERKIFERYSSV